MKPRRLVAQVKVLYFEECPNWKVARQRLQHALEATGLAAEIEVSYQTVETREEAERVGFRGSPTILVDGRDPGPETASRSGCRAGSM